MRKTETRAHLARRSRAASHGVDDSTMETFKRMKDAADNAIRERARKEAERRVAGARPSVIRGDRRSRTLVSQIDICHRFLFSANSGRGGITLHQYHNVDPCG